MKYTHLATMVTLIAMFLPSNAFSRERPVFKVKEYFIEDVRGGEGGRTQYSLVLRNGDNEICSYFEIGLVNLEPVIQMQILQDHEKSPYIIRKYGGALYLVFLDPKGKERNLKDYIFLKVSYTPISPHIKAEYVEANAELFREVVIQSRMDLESEIALDAHIKGKDAGAPKGKVEQGADGKTQDAHQPPH